MHVHIATLFVLQPLVQPYDRKKQFTTTLKKLERAANIPLLTVEAVKQKLPVIKTYVGFKLRTYQDASTSSFLQYMYSWLSAYESKRCTTEPTWSNFLDALRCVKLAELAEQIDSCLKTAPAIVEAKPKEGTSQFL